MNTPAGPAHRRTTLAQVADADQLASAWADVLASDRDDGVLSASVTRFAEAEEEHLAEIAAQVAAGQYEPGRLTPVRCSMRAKKRAMYQQYEGSALAVRGIAAS
jgi:hypothetical protein